MTSGGLKHVAALSCCLVSACVTVSTLAPSLTVQVSVVDRASHQPLVSTLRCNGSPCAKTDAQGHATVPATPTHELCIEASAPQHAPFTVCGTPLNPGEVWTFYLEAAQ